MSSNSVRTGRWGVLIALGIFFGGLISNFHGCFQFTHDCWLVMLALDLVILQGPVNNALLRLQRKWSLWRRRRRQKSTTR